MSVEGENAVLEMSQLRRRPAVVLCVLVVLAAGCGGKGASSVVKETTASNSPAVAGNATKHDDSRSPSTAPVSSTSRLLGKPVVTTLRCPGKELYSPAADARGDVFVYSASGAGCVFKITPSAVSNVLISGSQLTQAPIACDQIGDVFFFESQWKLCEMNAQGKVTFLAGQPRKLDLSGSIGSADQTVSVDGRGAAAAFTEPTDLACDEAGNVYVGEASAT